WRLARERHREEQRMRQELEYAREVQLSMLPSEAPALPWLEMARLSLPATEVGGDYYDFFAIHEDRMLVVIGDVAGHGLASGIVLASIRSGLTLLVDDIEDSPTVMERLNRMLRETSRTRVLVSLGLVLFDRSGRVTVTSAGHPPALLWRSLTGEVETIDLPSLPLGTGLASEPKPRVINLEAGDTILLYTDGLFEATDSSGEPMGLDRLTEVFAASAEKSLEDLKADILQSAWRHRGASPQEDDITLVAVRYSGESDGGTSLLSD
ncbi:MAG: PP2C family protein-serine/threonine phosphatase, partial [Thermoanaerobaculia bacterium]|nr:PP2C family protein-serine/threonine phosphatase [Thermoanaerobaculia bacterium]